MAREAIRDKLLPKLTQVIRNESQVLYIMSRLRKLLEHSNTQQDFPLVNFYCNWVLHTKLDLSNAADDIVRVLDDLHKNLNMGTKESLAKADLLSFSSLRLQLKECLANFALPATICDSNVRFKGFVRNLGELIQDTPLYIQRKKVAQQTAYVESVAVKVQHDAKKRLVFMWKVTFHTVPSNTFTISMTLDPNDE